MPQMNIPTDYLIYPAFILIGLLAGWLLGRRNRPAEDHRLTFEEAMRRWRSITQAAEGALLDNIAATTPWLAPALPAAIAYGNMTNHLGFDEWLAFIGALVIEFLGLAAVHTAFQLWEFNETKNDSEQAAPFRWSVYAGAFYLFIIIVVNIILETAVALGMWLEGSQILGKALLSLLSVVAAFVLALRSQHARRLAVKEQKTQERRDANELGRLRKLVGELETAVSSLRDELQTELDRTAALEITNAELRERAEQWQEEVGKLRENAQKLQGELTAVSAKSAERSAQNTSSPNGKVSSNLPDDWRKLDEAQIRELAVLSREEREKRFPKLKTRTRQNWHERLDEAKEKYAQENSGGEWGTW